ncbi:tRNA modification GTPase GTPBP3, mitochondrial [Prorops nasuta]|uniref:tRNA modification GTPase GTPBP3, mitochondrial n=1 Tax=Prorops nasuta TaxID=863751 RepID=UPI0034CD2E77
MYHKVWRTKLLGDILIMHETNRILTVINSTNRFFFTNLQKCRSTIYALSSGQGKCGVAVVRVSGDEARCACFKMTNIQKLESRKALFKTIYDPVTKEVIDKGLCLWFPAPNSFTGEDTVEFHVHGSLAVIKALMSALSKLNFVAALPGEFTKRAFYNKKMDLTKAEGLADLIHAETDYQRRQALLQAHGVLNKLYLNWRNILQNCIANFEAYIDFSEEDNIDNVILENSNIFLKQLLEDIQRHLSDGRKGEILRNGVKTVIIGEPNVGKSSLLNHLLQKNAAIVSSIAGTTRDVIEVSTNISGYPVVMVDTAGITNDSKNEIELEGIRRAKEYIEIADFIILAADSTKYISSSMKFKDYINSYISSLNLKISMKKTKHFMVVMNKIDLLDDEGKQLVRNENVVMLSCKTKEGLSNLIKSISSHLEQLCGNPSADNPAITQIRYRNHLTQCLYHLQKYFEIINFPEYDVAVAVEEIRLAMKELGKITGHVTPDEILNIIFTKFCIGK